MFFLFIVVNLLRVLKQNSLFAGYKNCVLKDTLAITTICSFLFIANTQWFLKLKLYDR